MVCLYCNGSTQVKNSRPHDNNYAVWRRRACTACGAVITTEEQPLLSTAFVVTRSDGSFTPFDREKLFVSLYESCRHREQPTVDASALTKTILARILRSPNKNPGSIAILDIIETATQVLHNFDHAAYTHYMAYYGKR